MKLASVVWLRFAGACIVFAAILTVGAASASATVVHLKNGHALGVERVHGKAPAAARTPASKAKLEYHGGPIMPSNTNYAVYWDPSGAPAYPAEYESGLDTYFEDLAHDSGGKQNVDSVSTQYGDSAGEFANYSSQFGGALLDTDPYPTTGNCTKLPTCLTDAQIQEELKSYVKAHSLPHDLTHEYFVLTPPEVRTCFEIASAECSAYKFEGAYCAYHGFISMAGGSLIYSDDPYVTGTEGCDNGEHPNEKPSDGALEGGLSHEHNESITDPELDAWYGGPEGEEIGDKCRTFVQSSEYGTPLGTAPDGSFYNQVINSHLYWYQQEWSNEGLTCLQRFTPGSAGAPKVTKVSPISGSAAGGATVTITGVSLTGATAVKFGTSSAKAFKVLSSTSISATTPASAAGVVDVTVTTPGGTSEITLKDHYRFIPQVTGVSPNSGPTAGGTTVTITGAGFNPGTGTTTFKFGTTTAKGAVCASSVECTVAAPKHAAGTVNVVALANAVRSPTSEADRYTYA